MAKLISTSPYDGQSDNWNGVSITAAPKIEIVALSLALGEEESSFNSFKQHYAASLPAPNQLIKIHGGHAMWTGQSQYFLMLAGENIGADLDVSSALGSGAYTALQSDGWAMLDIKGERIFDVLERFIPLDLHGAPDMFAARTAAHHIAVIVLRFDDNHIRLMTPRSTATSFLEALRHTADNTLN